MIILTFLCIIIGIIIWNLYHKSNKKNENFNCSATTPSITRSGERTYFTNTLLDGRYNKEALYNSSAYHQKTANNKISEFKDNFLDSKKKHDGTRRTFDELSADIPGYYSSITNKQTESVNTIQKYKTDANDMINSTDNDLNAYVTQKHNVELPDKIQNELIIETNKQLSYVRDDTSNYNNVIDFNKYLTQETRDTNLNGTEIIDSFRLLNKIQGFLPYKSFKLLYSANSRNRNYSPENFHEACDNKKTSSKMPTLTIYKTDKGSILLGYNNDGWQSYGTLTSSAYGTNWISLLKGGNLGDNEPNRYFNKSNLDKSLYNNYYSGPQFGLTELLIKDNKVLSSIIISKVSKLDNSSYGYDSKLNIQQIEPRYLQESTNTQDKYSFFPNGNETFDSIEVFQVLDEMVRIYDWQKQNNKIIRVKGDTGNIQCFAKTPADKQSRNCDEITSINEFNKLTSNEIFTVDCRESDIQDSNHWCHQASKEFNKDPVNINYDVCPVGWSVVNNTNNPTKTMCFSPSGSINPISLKDDTLQMKRSRLDARFPFKYDYTSSFLNDDLRANIRKNVSNVLGTSTTPIQVNLDRFNFNRNGVMINVFNTNPENTPPKGRKISTEMITTAVNFNWGTGPIFRMTNNVYIEFITYVLIPNGAKTVSFSLTADNSARLAIANDGTTQLKMLLNWTALGNTSTSSPIMVKEKTFLPLQVDYHCAKPTDSASVSLSWSIDNGPMQIISRDNYFLSKEQCSQLDAAGNATIPIAKDCSYVSCDIEGQRCLAGTPGAGTDNWICKDNTWVLEPK